MRFPIGVGTDTFIELSGQPQLKAFNIMLSELKNVRQVDGEPIRRWFHDEFFDLIVWFSESDEITEFQLCYDLTGYERALTWKKDSGFLHEQVDQGESRPGQAKATPILVKDGIFKRNEIAERFKEDSRDIDKEVSEFVYSRLMEFPV